MPFAINQGVRIHYQVEGEGPPLVLQHGFTQKVKRWYMAGYVDALKPNYQLVLVDARGHGASDKPHDPAAYTLPLQVGDVVAVLDALHLSKAHFWGYSMGGRIGFGMSKYAPARVHSLTIGGAHPYGQQLPAASRLDDTAPEAFAAAFLERLGVNPATLPPEIREELLANDFQALAAAHQDVPSMEEVLPTMTMPCLLYIGEADRSFSQAQACIQHMPNVTFVSFPGFNHAEAFYRADVVLPHITKFLQAGHDGIQTMA
jgi:pimeloyl-ACP methyl ester carboxylesterase